MSGPAGWAVTDKLELSLVGYNLLHEHHPEFGSATSNVQVGASGVSWSGASSWTHAGGTEFVGQIGPSDAAALLAATLGTLSSPGAMLAQGGSMEYAVKAAYLYKFAPFIDWPPAAFASASSSVPALRPG